MSDGNQINWVMEFFKIIPTLIVAAIAAYIAYQQWITARAKLNLDLFNRRFAVFMTTWETASRVLQSDKPLYSPPSFTNLYPEASFLFKPDVETFMKELADKMNNLAIIRELIVRNSDIVPPDKISDLSELQEWISNAAVEGIRGKFSPYLDFSKWR